MDYETNTTTRKIKETIHSLSNDNHINGISYRLPHIWFPALKLKGGSEVNTSSNQNEETNNQSQAICVFTQVRRQCIKSAGQPSLFEDSDVDFEASRRSTGVQSKSTIRSALFLAKH